MTEITHKHWVVIPCYNEERWIGTTIDALGAQTDSEFVLVVVDNASTDNTAEAVTSALARNPHITGLIIREDEKGTGCAADTGFRYAIDHGAEIVFRTDADCLPTATWFAELKRAMVDRNLDAAGGRLKIRTDDVKLSPLQLFMSRLGAVIVPRIAPYISTNRGPDYKVKYVMLPGPNVAIRSTAYVECGGYPRRSFDVAFLDKEIVNTLRLHTARIEHVRSAVVMFSERRTQAYGVRGTIAWLRNRGGVRGGTDVR